MATATGAGAPVKATRRELWAWYLYDFGNSAYAAVVLLAVYSAYFKGTVVGGAEGSRLWGLSVGIAMLAVAVTSPIVGVIADYTARKKGFLFFFTALACVFTGALFFVRKGDIVMGMVFFILAEFGYRSAQVFYDALLPELASPEEMGRISGNGWAIGSLGGIVCLLIILPLIMFIGGEFITRLSLVITAVFYAVSSVPVFLWVRERAKPQAAPKGTSLVAVGFKRLWSTFKKARHFREYIKFIISFLVYNDGILMAMDFSAIIGAVLFGMKQEQLVIFMIIVQITSVAGAYVFGVLTDKTSGKRSLVISLLLMLAAIVWMFFNESLTAFFVIGGLAGFALTGVQSVSRTVVGMFSPPGQSGEFYGLFAVSGRTSSFIGPTIYGWLAAEAALWYQARGHATLAAEQMGQRVAIISIAVFLVAGLLLLLTVNERKARAAATQPASE
ncbi:MAG: MFS transporter [Anaerolineales bacterium]|nr:MFS transporter [Anaerolineales bacterium]